MRGRRWGRTLPAGGPAKGEVFLFVRRSSVPTRKELPALNIWVGLWVFLMSTSFVGCKKKASAEEIAAAKKALKAYNVAWMSGDVETMFRLSTKDRIKRLTDLDPTKGKAYEKKAKDRFGLLAKQTKQFYGYVDLKVVEVAGSKPGKVIFKLRALHRPGSRVQESSLLRQLVKKDGKWLLN